MFQHAQGVVLAVALAGLFCHASCPAQSIDGQAEFREFRDQRGRAMQARVLKVSGDEVTIERRDGRKFTLAISVFSQTDRNYIRGLTEQPLSAATGDDWPCFRGPGGMGVSDATGLPLEGGRKGDITDIGEN